MPIAPSSLDSTALAARLRELAGESRNVDVDFILHLDEYDRRRAYLEAGFGSLWAYCLEALHLREGSAGRRIQAMRVLRRFPSLEGALRDGRLSLSTIALLGQVLTPENLEDVLARAAFKTRADVDHLVASIQARPAPKDGIRKIPDRRIDAAVSSLPLASTGEPPSTHVQSAALGGKATVDEMRVLCRPHNMLHAEQVFGREYMARFRRTDRFTEPDADARGGP